MKWFKSKQQPPTIEIDKTKITYHLLGDCYKCKQPIINDEYYPSFVKEVPYKTLEGTYIQGVKSVEIENGFSFMETKMFYYHNKCPDDKVEIPFDIQIRCGLLKLKLGSFK